MDDDDTDVLVVVMVQNSRCSVSDGDRLAPQSCNVRRPAPGLEKRSTCHQKRVSHVFKEADSQMSQLSHGT